MLIFLNFSFFSPQYVTLRRSPITFKRCFHRYSRYVLTSCFLCVNWFETVKFLSLRLYRSAKSWVLQYWRPFIFYSLIKEIIQIKVCFLTFLFENLPLVGHLKGELNINNADKGPCHCWKRFESRVYLCSQVCDCHWK